jgi:hypothetical protein
MVVDVLVVIVLVVSSNTSSFVEIVVAIDVEVASANVVVVIANSSGSVVPIPSRFSLSFQQALMFDCCARRSHIGVGSDPLKQISLRASIFMYI